MSGDDRLCAGRILRMRIGFAIRRATGKVIDVDAMLSRPHLLARRLDTWRAVGSTELNTLIEQLERELAADLGASSPRPAGFPGPPPRAPSRHAGSSHP
jgi:hypothetical protein